MFFGEIKNQKIKKEKPKKKGRIIEKAKSKKSVGFVCV